MINSTSTVVKPPDATNADSLTRPIAREREEQDVGPEDPGPYQENRASTTTGVASARSPDSSSPVETSLVAQQPNSAVQAGLVTHQQPSNGVAQLWRVRLAEMRRGRSASGSVVNTSAASARSRPDRAQVSAGQNTSVGMDGDPAEHALLADRPKPVDNGNPATDPPVPYIPVEASPFTAPTSDEMLSWLELYVEPGQVTELRILKVKDPKRPDGAPCTISGFYDSDHLAHLVHQAQGWTHHAQGVYVTLNPIDPELLAVRRNAVEKYPNKTTDDGDILRRRLLMVDVDPFRFSETSGKKITSVVSATDSEKVRAREVAEKVYQFLRERGWPDPVVVDSGNGYQLLYRVDEPADDDGLIRRCLQTLAARFDDAGAEVDRKVFNPARIAKLPGTLARKGEDVP